MSAFGSYVCDRFLNVSDTRCAWRRPAWGRRSTRFALLSRLSHAVSVAVGLLIYVMAARIGRQRRHPSAAMGCVLAIVAFSYAAVPLFLMFGSRKFVRPLRRCRPHAGGRTGIAGCRPAVASFAGTVTPAWVRLGYAAAGGAGAGATGAQCAHRLPGAGREGAGGPAGHGGLCAAQPGCLHLRLRRRRAGAALGRGAAACVDDSTFDGLDEVGRARPVLLQRKVEER